MLRKEDRKKSRRSSPTDTVQGWFEILFYFGTDTVLKSEEYISMRNYMLSPVRLAIAEFYGPYDVYESMFRDATHDAELDALGHEPTGIRFGLPRMLGEYDIINAIVHDRKTRKVTTYSMLLIEEQKNLHLLFPNAQMQVRPGRPLAGLMLSNPLPPMKR